MSKWHEDKGDSRNLHLHFPTPALFGEWKVPSNQQNAHQADYTDRRGKKGEMF